jgi:hypothetical protein
MERITAAVQHEIADQPHHRHCRQLADDAAKPKNILLKQILSQKMRSLTRIGTNIARKGEHR